MFPQNYEFNESENSVFADVASRMKAVGFFSVFFGSLSIILSTFALIQSKDFRLGSSGIGGISQGLFFLLIGIWTRDAGSSFRQIVDSKGNDIRNLMDAIGSLKKLYTLQYWLLVIALVLVAIALLAGLSSAFSTLK
jgi:hypothetical protein